MHRELATGKKYILIFNYESGDIAQLRKDFFSALPSFLCGPNITFY